MGSAATTAFAVTVVPSRLPGKAAPGAKLNMALIGVGGQGGASIKDESVQNENIVALCDVDLERAGGRIKTHTTQNPRAKVYRDFRKMLDEMGKDIDAVMVATPDHTHYVAAMAAIERGKHVYCEKPLAHSIYETRQLTQAARRHNVATQMGNQGHSSEHIRLCCEWIGDGALGDVREVHAWSNRPTGGYAFPASMGRPKDEPPVPKALDWDLWLGPASYRPYHPAYCPIYWRAWLDFGTGPIGDMGCHILDPAFWALKLGSPTSVEANVSYNGNPEYWMPRFDGTKNAKTGLEDYLEAIRKETYPTAAIVRYEFPARGKMPPVKLTWYDGGLMPPKPEGVEKGSGGNGAYIIGDKASIKHGSHGAGGCRIVPEVKMKAYMGKGLPPQTLERVPKGKQGHRGDWVRACKGANPAGANFDYGGPLTELVLLGVIAMRVPDRKLLWDAERMAFSNSKEATALVKPQYREGWTLCQDTR